MGKGNNKDLRILIINYEFPPLGGGGGIASSDLAKEWRKLARIDVLTSSFKRLKPFEVRDEISIYRAKTFFRKSKDAATFISMLSFLPSALIIGMRLFRKNRYNIINTHFAVPSGPVGYLLGKLFHTPNVLSLHGGDIYDPSKSMSPHRNVFFRIIVRFILNRADEIIAQSSNTKLNAIKYYKPWKEIKIVPLAYHPTEIPVITRKEMKIKSDEFILITIGRLVKRKAMDVIINAISMIPDDRIQLFIVGDGPDRINLENLVKNLKLEKRIHFLGYLSDEEKYKYLSVSDIFILPSMHEGFGIVYMEAMYCGLPIVCTNHGGQTDFLINGENAILIDVGDIKACSEAILKFYKDKEFYDNCSENNSKKIIDFYAEPIAMRYIEIFRDLLSGETIGR
ncbi:MAG: glycosyltransferase family 4 protein [Spirochaetota bacterium]|nr:glycosyltransferase family 4 protein [Spirochaetota bacterium]